MRLLVAEDDCECRQLLVATLRRLGYEVTAARDAAETRRLLAAADGPRLAILDWSMPDMDGVVLCRWLRSRPDPVSRYVVALVPHDRTAAIAAALQAGADDCLTRPFCCAELEARVRVAVRTLRLQRRLAEHGGELDGRSPAGMVHEIDAPIRSVGDDARFLATGFASLHGVLARYRAFRALVAGCVDTALVRELRAAERAADIASLEEEIPRAIDRTLAAVHRVTTVLRAARQSGEPGVAGEHPVAGPPVDQAPIDVIELLKDVPAGDPADAQRGVRAEGCGGEAAAGATGAPGATARR